MGVIGKKKKNYEMNKEKAKKMTAKNEKERNIEKKKI